MVRDLEGKLEAAQRALEKAKAARHKGTVETTSAQIREAIGLCEAAIVQLEQPFMVPAAPPGSFAGAQR